MLITKNWSNFAENACGSTLHNASQTLLQPRNPTRITTPQRLASDNIQSNMEALEEKALKTPDKNQH
jgi:hypothetical protein